MVVWHSRVVVIRIHRLGGRILAFKSIVESTITCPITPFVAWGHGPPCSLTDVCLCCQARRRRWSTC